MIKYEDFTPQGHRSFFLLQEKFTTRHELALLRVSALMGLVMFGGMTSLFYTQMAGILSVSTESWPEDLLSSFK